MKPNFRRQVKLWYDKMDYKVRLGSLVSIWTPHISHADNTSMVGRASSLVTSIFPEKDNTCYFMVQEESDEGTLCKAPLRYREGKQLPGLMTLKSFLDGGAEVLGAKILVCVKSIGGRKTCNVVFLRRGGLANGLHEVTTKKGNQVETVSIGVFDDTSDATLQLWSSAAASASSWKASNTILLLSNPGLKGQGRPTITVEQNTYVDVDPFMADAFWLRSFGQSLTKREHVNPAFPENGKTMARSLCIETNVVSVRYRGCSIIGKQGAVYPRGHR